MYDDDDYYDDDGDYEDSSGSGRLILILVILMLLGILFVFTVVFVIFVSKGGLAIFQGTSEPPPISAPAEPVTEAPTAAPTEANLLEDGFGPMDGSGFDAATAGSGDSRMRGRAEPSAAEPVRDQDEYAEDPLGDDSWSDPPPARSRSTDSGRSGRPAQRPPSPAASSSRSSSRSGGSSSSRSSSSRSSGSRSSSSRSRSDEDLLIRSESSDRSSARSSSSSAGSSRDQPRVLGDDEMSSSSSSQRASSSDGPPADLDKDTISAMSGRASAGRLTSDELRQLRSLPKSHSQFTLAWATAMKHAEVKGDYKGHCEAARRIIELPRNKYHPEWNLEFAKCQLRNGDFEAAIRSIDRTLADSMSMTGSTKMQRLLLAYEIKARGRTRLYDDHAKANAGLGDEIKLNAALQAWTSYRNYAVGIGDQQALRKSDREIADLSARK